MHHIYAEHVQPTYQQNVTHPSTTSFNVTRANQLNQPPPPPPPMQSPSNPQQQHQQQQQHMHASNATNITNSMQNLSLVDNNVVFVHNEGIPIMRKSDSDSASSGESNEDSTPHDPPSISSDITNSSNVGNTNNSSINKKYKHTAHGDPKPQSSSRHKISAQQHQQQQHQQHHHQIQHIVYGQMIPPIPASAALNSDIVLASNISQSQPQQTQISQTQPTQQAMNMNPSTAIPGFSIANQQVFIQQYPPQSTHPIQKSQLNTTYHYHTQHMPISNRGSILTTTSGQQQTPGTYRMQPFHVNGELMYPFPSQIAYMQSAPALPLTRPSSTSNQTHTVVPTPQLTMHHLPALTSLSSKTNQTVITSPFLLANENVKPNISCFNCGSNSHTGHECEEESMENVTRDIYKLDYSTSENDSVKSTPELDNGGNGGSGGGVGGVGGGTVVKTNETITHMPVLNK